MINDGFPLQKSLKRGHVTHYFGLLRVSSSFLLILEEMEVWSLSTHAILL